MVIYPNDHRPAHIHVIGRGHEVVFYLNCPDGPAELRENYGFAKRQLTKLRESVTKHVEKLCREWEGIHGVG